MLFRSKRDVAALAPLVIRAADLGDVHAARIVSEAVAALTELVRGVASRDGSSGEGRAVVLWGGLLADQGPLASMVSAALRTAGFEVVERRVDPPMGAARLALRS